MKALRVAALAILLWMARSGVFAFVFVDGVPAWPNGKVTLEIQLGTTPTYSDGTTPNATAIQALGAWNPSMSRVQLAYVNNSGAAHSRTNGKNNVFFDTSVYGTAFGDGVLALTVGRTTSTAPVEMDVVVNRRITWDSYRGSLRTAVDLRRVLTHEFGHVLGLDHPDDRGQWPDAIMLSRVSDRDSLGQDDMNGASARYGRGPGNPAIPPTIVGEPVSRSVIEGENVYFLGTAEGSAPMSYQWFKDGVAIPGATDYLYQLNPAHVGDAGRYKIRFTNDGGSVTSQEAVLDVTPAAPPTFTSQPWPTLTVEAGGGTSFSALATSNSPVSYQWYRNGVAIPGAIDHILGFVPARESDSGVYHVVATTLGGVATSTSGTLTVTPPQLPRIERQPESASVMIGRGVWISATITAINTPTYQWEHDGVPVPGVTSASIVIDVNSAADGGSYRVRATNIAGTVLSEPAIITVLPMPRPPPIYLADATVESGGQFNLSVFYADYRSTRYQWYKDGQPIPGATYASYGTMHATFDMAGEYFVVATNDSGTTTSDVATVRVIFPYPAWGVVTYWRQAAANASRACFIFEPQPRLETFDFATEQWLAPVPFTEAPWAVAIEGESTAIVAFFNHIDRVNFTTGERTLLTTTTRTPTDLVVVGDRLYLLAYEPETHSLTTWMGTLSLAAPGAIVWSDGEYERRGLAIDPVRRRAYSMLRSSGTLLNTALNDDGTFGGLAVEPSAYEAGPVGVRPYLSPDGRWLCDEKGNIFSGEAMRWVRKDEAPSESIEFSADGSMTALRGRTIHCYGTDLLETGRIELAHESRFHARVGSTLYTFQPTTMQPILWEKHGLAEQVRPVPAPAMQADLTAFIPDQVLLDRDGTLLLYSKLQANIARWSTKEQRFLEPIRLTARPNRLAYLSGQHRIYGAFPDGSLRYIPLTGEPLETWVTTGLPQSLALCAAGDLLVLSEFGGSSQIHIVDATGVRPNPEGWNGTLGDGIWSESRRRIYHINSNTIGYSTLSPSGAFDANLWGPKAYVNTSFAGPLSLSPDEDLILITTGQMFNADTLRQNNALPQSHLDAAWLGNRVYTIRDLIDGVEICRWGGANYAKDASCHLTGRTLRLLTCGTDRLVAATNNGGRLALTLLDAELNVRTHFEDHPDLSKVTLANLSTRSRVGTGDNVMIAGFVVNGAQPKRVLIRAVGPTLRALGVSGELLDPMLRLVDAAGNPLRTDDDWHTEGLEELRAAFQTVGAFDLPDDSRDAALIAELAPGRYTAQVSGNNGTTGIALVETYDLDADPGERRLINISTRAEVRIGDSIMIAGLVINGENPKRVLIRAVGPGLNRFGVAGLLADPTLRVVNTAHATILSNDDWGSDNTDATEAARIATGAFPLNPGSHDAALVATLSPGIYTVVVSGVNDTTGIALVEIYEVP